MLLYCPHCQSSFPTAERCPQCQGRLVTPSEMHTGSAERSALRPPDLIRPTAAGRLVVGVVAGLGLFVGLREWAAAGLGTAGESWRGHVGLAVTGTLKLAAAAVAGLLAGTGRPKGASAGVTAGLLVGVLLLAAERSSGGGKFEPLEIATVIGLAAAAAAGGAVGSWRWPAPVDLPPPPSPQGSSLAGLIAKETGPGERPLRWVRVAVGGLIAAAGIALADPMRELFKHGSAGSVAGGTSMVTVVDLEIAGLFVMFGGAVAGAATGVGARHGVLAALVGGLLTVWMPAAGVRSVFPVVEGLLKVLGLPTNDLAGPGAAFNLLLAVLAVGCFGGWLGGTLMPPVVPKDKVKKRLVYS